MRVAPVGSNGSLWRPSRRTVIEHGAEPRRIGPRALSGRSSRGRRRVAHNPASAPRTVCDAVRDRPWRRRVARNPKSVPRCLGRPSTGPARTARRSAAGRDRGAPKQIGRNVQSTLAVHGRGDITPKLTCKGINKMRAKRATLAPLTGAAHVMPHRIGRAAMSWRGVARKWRNRASRD
jgi:hypothetical protein